MVNALTVVTILAAHIVKVVLMVSMVVQQPGQPCKECMCPGGTKWVTNLLQLAFTINVTTRSFVIVSLATLVPSATKCAINYYGNPLEPGGSCKTCECNGNTDTNDPTSCDQESGKCRNCLYNTAGDYCETCREGFFGNASNHECRRKKYFKDQLHLTLIISLKKNFQLYF